MNLLHDRETVIVVCSGTRQDLRCVQHHFTHAGHRAQAVCRVFDRHLRMLSNKNQNQFIKLCFHSRCWGCPLLVGYKIKTSIQFCVLKKTANKKVLKYTDWISYWASAALFFCFSSSAFKPAFTWLAGCLNCCRWVEASVCTLTIWHHADELCWEQFAARTQTSLLETKIKCNVSIQEQETQTGSKEKFPQVTFQGGTEGCKTTSSSEDIETLNQKWKCAGTYIWDKLRRGVA